MSKTPTKGKRREANQPAEPENPVAGDTVTIRTDDGVIHATVDSVAEMDRPEDGARLGGTADVDEPAVHYVDYWHVATDEIADPTLRRGVDQ